MKKLVKALLVLFSVALPFQAEAQPIGQLQSGQTWGNPSSSQAPATGTLLGPLLDKGYCSSLGNILYRGSSVWQCLTPAANSVLVTNGSNTPSYATSLPSGLTIPSFAMSGTNTGSATFSGNNTFSAQAIFSGTSGPSSTAGYTVVMGTLVSIPTLANTGQAWLFNMTADGAVLQGDGSTYDLVLANKGGSIALQLPTGTTVPQFPGLSVGTCSSGLALDASNNLVKDSCPGAASSIQVGTTSVNSGTSGYVLSNNAGVLGNVQAPILLATLTASGSANLNDTTHLTNAYTDYMLVFDNLIPVTTNASCELLVHSGGSFQSSSYLENGFLPNGTAIISVTATTTYIPLCNNTSLVNSAPGLSGHLILHNPSASSLHPIEGLFSYIAAGAPFPWTITGYWNSSAVVDGFEFLFSTGNISSGSIRIYGIP